jgi:TonB-linked SusC/RagA family outer membrane protein
MTNRVLLSILFFLLVVAFASGQQVEIKGVVTGEDHEGLPGATVQVKGTSIGVITDINGAYSITVIDVENPVLLFSYVGYLSEEIPVDNRAEINVTLSLDMQSLDEVVVVGYGVIKKSLVTGSIAKVDGETLNQNQSLRVEQSLQGKVSGVAIAQNSGSPGGGMTVRIRGIGSNSKSDPLYVLDGMKVGGIEDINPNDIESIEILKDAASSAIYGSEAANGVVLITSKKGKKGMSTASYNGYYGINYPTKMPKLLTSEQYVKYLKEAHLHEKAYRSWRRGDSIPYNDPDLIAEVNEEVPYNEDTVGAGTDWMGEILSPASVQSHNLSFSGGNENTSYYISAGYYDEDGIIGAGKANFKRYTVNVNGTHEVNDWLEVYAKLNYINRTRTNIDENNEFAGIVAMAANIDPLTPVVFDDPSQLPQNIPDSIVALVPQRDGQYYGLSNEVFNEIANPVAWMDITHMTWKQNKTLGKAGLKVKFLDFTYNPAISFENWNGTWEDWKPAYYFHGLRQDPKSYIRKEAKNGLKFFFDQYLDYSKTFGSHYVGAMAGMSYEQYKEVYMGAENKMLLYETPEFAYLSMAQQPDSIIPKPWDGVEDEFVLISYFGRINYNYKEKYLATFNLRADGSNKFGPNNRWGYFPSASLGYIVSREDFWPVQAVSFFKIRGSWGRNGSTSNLTGFDWTSTISFDRNIYPFGNTNVTGARPERAANPDLRWEQSEQLDVGIDAGFLQNRIFFTADYFSKKTIDLIVDATPPLYTGNPPPKINAGNIVNKGWEFDLTANEAFGDFNFSVTFNASYTKNKVISLTEDIQELIGASVGVGEGNVNKFEVGYPAWYFWGYQTDGIFYTTGDIANHVDEEGNELQLAAIPGDIRFLDVSGVDSLGDLTGLPDGTINENDKVYLGQPYPKWTFGMNINLEYKGIDFAMLWQGVTGNSIYNGTYRADLSPTNNKPLKYWDERWDYTNPTADNGWFRPTVNDRNRNFRPSDYFVENGAYLKLRQIMLGYTLPVSLTEKIKISKLRFYVSAENVLTITKYTGGDPEIGQTNDDWAADVGIDRGFYPSAISVKFGVNVNF